MKKLKKGFRKGIAAITTAAICVTGIPTGGLATVSAADTDVTVNVDKTVKLQPGNASTFNDTNGDGLGEFEGWGTSLCWWANRIGYSDALTSQVTEAFFGDTGLDMNIGRYNVGGGDLTGEPTTVEANSNAAFYDLETEGRTPTYAGTSMSVGTISSLASATYTVSDADFGITKGTKVGSIKAIGWINKLGDTAGSGDNLHYNVSVSEAGKYTVKLLLTLSGTNARDVALLVNDTTEYVADADTINNNIIATASNQKLYLVTLSDVELNEGENTINIAGKSDWTLDFVKMAVILSGQEGTLPEEEEFLHSAHITRSDSAVPGYATDVTKIDLTQHELSYYEENFTRADADCGYAWNYDWDADKNQINVLKAAAAASGEDFIAEAFSNSPPYFMTVSGCSSGNVDASEDNLRADSYTAFAHYMADVIEHWNNEGVVSFSTATAMNEPYTNYWSANSSKQEGCHFDIGDSQSKMIVAFNEALQEKGINLTISASDETSIDTAITSFNALSTEAQSIVGRIDTHSYSGSNRSGLCDLAESAGKNLWMSEVDGSYTAGTNAGEMSAALGLAGEMAKDVNGLKATAWILWDAIDMHVDSNLGMSSDADYESLDALYEKNPMTSGYWGIAIADHDNEQMVLTKKYYAYGQFSRYIRPGYTIIGSSSETLAAYDSEGGNVVIVAMNTSADDKTWSFDLSKFNTMGSNVTAIRTSGSLAEGENWADVSASDDIVADTTKKNITATLKGNSITTYIVDGVTYDNSVEEITKIQDVDLYTVEGVSAVLPTTVTVTTNKNNTSEEAVTWNLTDSTTGAALDLTKDGQEIVGTVAGTDYTATATIHVIDPNVLYYIDCNNTESTNYTAINSYAGLLNSCADQAYTEGSWGYLDEYGQYNGSNVSDSYDGGWYAKSGQSIQYTIPMEAGTYNVSFGFKEWWSCSRKMTVTATTESGTVTLGTTNSSDSNNNSWNKETFSYTVDSACDVTFTVAKAESNDPVLSFIQIQKALNLDELEKAMKTASTLNTASYPDARVAALNTAVQAGVTLMMKSSTTQDEVDAGAKAINDALLAMGTAFTEEQLAANDYVLYLVNCGTDDATVVPDDYKLGVYQSNVDQQYGEDSSTGFSWGYEANDENTVIVKGGSGSSDITGSYIYMGTDASFVKNESGFKYDFELPERENTDYIVTIGVKNPWSSRTIDVNLEGETVESGITLGKGTLVEKTYETSVTDGQLNVMVHNPNRTSQYGDPVLSYIIVKAVAAYNTDTLSQKLQEYQTAMTGHNYADESKSAFDTAAETAQQLIDTQSVDASAIKAALTALESAYEGLKEIYDYSSITGTDGDQLYDTNGNKIQAHGGQIQQLTVDGVTKYYWYGEDKTNGYRPVVGVHLYTSIDLYNWTDEGVVLRSIPVSDEEYGTDQNDGYTADLSIFTTDSYFSSLYGDYADQAADDTANYSSKLEEVYWNLAEDRTVIERPKVLYNDTTGKYVMWFHADGRTPTSSADYGKARAGVAISDSPTGPFKLLGTYKLEDSEDADHSWDEAGGAVRDMNVFKDDDGQAYVIYSSDGNTTTYIAKLNDSYTGLATDPENAVDGTELTGEERLSADYTRNFIGASREAPAMFKYKGKYYIINSGCSGWSPNQANYAVADNPLGPWTVVGDPCVGDTSGTTFDTQSTCVFPVDAENGKFIYMGDRWYNPDNGADLSDSRYVWLPVEFLPDDKLQLLSYSDWTLDELENKGSFEITTELPELATSGSSITNNFLPDTVMVDYGDGAVEKAVTWDLGDINENTQGIVSVTGTITDGNRTFTHDISIVNSKLLYFFDCGATTSDYFNTIVANISEPLKNTAVDQSYTEENGAGYLGVVQSDDTDSYDMGRRSGDTYISNGWWAAGSKNIEYAFTLDAGTYTVSTGYQEWWSTARACELTVTAGDETLATQDFTIAKTSTNLQVDQTFTVTEENAGKVVVSIAKTGSSDPVLSWIAVSDATPEIVNVTDITLSQEALELEAGETETLTAQVLPENATNKAVTYTSSNEKVATVDENGVITAVAAGNCEITVSAQDESGVQAVCKVTVPEEEVLPQLVTAITLNTKAVELKVGKTKTLTATVAPADADNKEVTYTSSNKKVASVDGKGVITAVAAGSCNITVAAQDGSGIQAVCKVTVTKEQAAVQKVTNIKLSASKVELKVGKTKTVTATVTPSNAANKAVTYTSSNQKVATVDQKGVITAVAAGSCNITVAAKDGSGVKAVCKVTVTKDTTTTKAVTTIQYKLNGGKNNAKNPEKVTGTKTIKFQNPTRKGYIFKGWYTDSKFKKKITTIKTSTTKTYVLYARWEKVTVKKASTPVLRNTKAGQLTVNFTKMSGVKGYKITYAKDSKFKKGVKTITVTSNKKTITKLKKKTTYYVKIQAYKIDSTGAKIYGKESSVKKIKITK